MPSPDNNQSHTVSCLPHRTGIRTPSSLDNRYRFHYSSDVSNIALSKHSFDGTCSSPSHAYHSHILSITRRLDAPKPSDYPSLFPSKSMPRSPLRCLPSFPSYILPPFLTHGRKASGTLMTGCPVMSIPSQAASRAGFHSPAPASLAGFRG